MFGLSQTKPNILHGAFCQKICFYEKIQFVCGGFCKKMFVAIATFKGRCTILEISKTNLLLIIRNGFHLLTIPAGAIVTIFTC